MKMLKKLEWKIINEYLEKELLITQKHPTKDLWILNYSKTCQYERKWDIVTLSCRGLVVDSNGNVVCRPLKKFFNMEEYVAYEDLPNIPYGEDWEAYEKMDGSLGLLFYYDNEWIFTSRGSFTSEQAIKGYEFFERVRPYIYVLDKTKTYIFEILFPQNRIVVNYGNMEKLVLLGAIETNSGIEMLYDDMALTYGKFFEIVKKYEGIKDFEYMKALNLENKEGFVVRFSNGFRMKIKFESYIMLHQVATNTSSKDIWRCLRDNNTLDEIIDVVPDEMFKAIKLWETKIKEKYNTIKETNIENFNEIINKLNKRDGEVTKKTFAFEALKTDNPSILFKMFDNKSYDDIIWKLIEPKFEKIGFSYEEDE